MAEGTIRRGVIRYLYVIVDQSKSMAESDFKPSRLEATRRILQIFVSQYFDQNPISQLGLISSKSKLAHKLSELSGTPSQHLECLKTKQACEGVVSFQNALEMARKTLGHVPAHGSREVVLITGSLSTCDPSDIFMTISALIQERIRVSVISLSAEMYIARYVAEKTMGSFHVALNEEHLKTIIMMHLRPPATVASMTDSACVRMGFPSRIAEEYPSPCACHSDRMTLVGYRCPRCGAKNCDLPTDCPTCNLSLILSSHLARSYHHLFPLATFVAVETAPGSVCFACRREVKAGLMQCPKCTNCVCPECDTFIHDTLHNCPGCEER